MKLVMSYQTSLDFILSMNCNAPLFSSRSNQKLLQVSRKLLMKFVVIWITTLAFSLEVSRKNSRRAYEILNLSMLQIAAQSPLKHIMLSSQAPDMRAPFLKYNFRCITPNSHKKS